MGIGFITIDKVRKLLKEYSLICEQLEKDKEDLERILRRESPNNREEILLYMVDKLKVKARIREKNIIRRIKSSLNSLNEEGRKLIFHRHIKGLDLNLISAEYFVSRSTICRRLKAAEE